MARFEPRTKLLCIFYGASWRPAPFLEPRARIELATPSLPWTCSAVWAISAWFWSCAVYPPKHLRREGGPTAASQSEASLAQFYWAVELHWLWRDKLIFRYASFIKSCLSAKYSLTGDKILANSLATAFFKSSGCSFLATKSFSSSL